MSAPALPPRSAIKPHRTEPSPRIPRSLTCSDSGAAEHALLEMRIGPGMPADHHAERNDYKRASLHFSANSAVETSCYNRPGSLHFQNCAERQDTDFHLLILFFSVAADPERQLFARLGATCGLDCLSDSAHSRSADGQ